MSATDDSHIFDVVVIGGGNAGLCAALTAREAGASVVVLEAAPRAFRGGNSRHTRNLRCAHAGPTDLLPDTYSEDEYVGDIVDVTGNRTDDRLTRIVARESATCPGWMRRFGVRFQSSLRGTLHLARTNVFFLGGGKAVLNRYYAAAERLGIRIDYDAEVVSLDLADGRFSSVTVRQGDSTHTICGRAAVLASGGFESNLEWLRSAWGEAVDNFIIRGTPYNKGHILRLMLAAGAQAVSDATQCHAIAVDARAPKFDGGIATRVDSLSLGIVVNRHAERFYDEGEDFWPKRYAIWGRLIAQQPGQIAYSILDAKAIGKFIPPMFAPKVAPSIRELAAAMNLPPLSLERTVARYNAAVTQGTFDHSVLDNCRTHGLTPEKTHWARPLDVPPFWGFPLRPGITFTYLGLRVDDRARVLMHGGPPAVNIVAAGEIMAGNILGSGYAAGVGMAIGTVFGRIAGREAAHHAVR